MELRHLKAFVEVATQGSYVRAANSLGIAQSALSRQVASLEREVGGRLFHRNGRGVALTEIGQRVLPQGRALIADASAFAQAARSPADRPAGEVTMKVINFGPEDKKQFDTAFKAVAEDWVKDINKRGKPGTEVFKAFTDALTAGR